MSETMRSDDPVLWPYWEAAARRELAVQKCRSCGHHQHYPRPFCLACDHDGLDWVTTLGRGTVHSVTTVHVALVPDRKPPYQVVLVALDEGPRLIAGIEGAHRGIGDRVRVIWREREGMPPLPYFEADPG